MDIIIVAEWREFPDKIVNKGYDPESVNISVHRLWTLTCLPEITRVFLLSAGVIVPQNLQT